MSGYPVIGDAKFDWLGMVPAAYLKFLLHILLCYPTTGVLETMTPVRLGVIAMFLSPHPLLST